MAAEPSSTLLPFNTLIHMVTIKLSSSNYLLWKSQLLPLLESQELIGHVDGTLEPPPRFAPANSQTPNIKHLAWKQTDQRLLSLLLSSLTEEAMAEVVGLTTSREVWIALENTFSHRSKAREIRLKDDLQLMKRSTRTVSEYARAFKTICDQLHAIGRAVDGTDKVHWFLHGLGLKFSSFSTAQMALTPLPCFADLVPKAESFELFQKSLEPAVPTVATHSLLPTAPPKNRISGTLLLAILKATMWIDADNGMIAMVIPLKLSLPKPSLPHVPSLEMKPQIEFTSNRFQAQLHTSGIHHQLSCPHTPAQNGRAERKHHHVTETGLALLFHSHIPTHFWVDAFSTAAYIINRLPTPLLRGKSPFELLYGSSPNYENFHPFGCRVYPCLCNYMTNKFSPRSIPCIFMGYSSSHKGFRCLDPTTSRIYITRHAQFDEHHFPFHHTSQAQPMSSLQISNFLEPSLSPTDMSLPSLAPHSQHIPQSGSNPCIICIDPVNESMQVTTSHAGSSLLHSNSNMAPPEPVTVLPIIAHPPISVASSSSHPMFTRAKACIFKTRHPAHLGLVESSGLLSALLASTEPKGFKFAAKNPAWLAAMDEEIQALQSNRTWILVSRPANTNIVGSKWVFRTKYLPDGSIKRLKAHLVAKGYTQVGLDYTDTFSPVIKATSVRVPPGYIDPRFPNHVCQLKKALYGLKQAPRAWFQRFSSFLLQLGFYCSRADTSLFVFHKHSDIIYLLLYVDDIIITGNNPSLLENFTCKLNSEFATKDLGSLSYFLGLEATPTTDGLFISQLKYARDILTRAQLLDSKPVHTPMVVSQHLSADGPLFSDPTLYRSLVGALQYLTITRPDIAHAVNSLLTLDADWAGCPDTRRSTSGYSIYLGDNLVSWSAKKQPTVSRSSCESEYRALALTAAEIVWLTHLLRDLKVSHSQSPLLLCDNKSAIFLSSNPVSHKRAKHVELDYHFLRELVLAGKLRTQYVPSHLQVADIFTKSVSRPLFEFFRSKLHVCSNPTLSLRGGVKDHVKDPLP
uniref:Integrase catalytic domain-containing protein n=1 Tax=Fagus sylvatica TaxID=28930 RepID=A0A2N9GCL0_FAGSY